jgi:hypothetical protein
MEEEKDLDIVYRAALLSEPHVLKMLVEAGVDVLVVSAQSFIPC